MNYGLWIMDYGFHVYYYVLYFLGVIVNLVIVNYDDTNNIFKTMILWIYYSIAV